MSESESQNILKKPVLFNPVLLFLYGAILSFLGLFIGAAILHCFFKMFGGKGNYKQTLGIEAYAYVIQAISWIPFIGFFAGLYALYIIIRGGEVKHNLSLGKSIAAVILSVLVPLLLFGGLFVAAVGMMRG